jgi:5-carboxymethyl-2-hydroxymuconate isomerase
MKVGRGRELEVRERLGRQLFDIVVQHLQPISARQDLAISFEMRELEEQVKFNHRNY